ncbi:RIO1-domain-containing protein [Sistotremastrum suecicum HHB10207 ss-3]|uniref:Serine/threonine-protein kinase RIO2 n=1 Tax=Sistotremastrum suecicum HHB10207 ss-3 TaxID=1314776 RepID=A0A166EYL8_9AGAM|nr:RIO1-domain-containing protein [Sistotremastrum suecicum HHB10207 ss-3]
MKLDVNDIRYITSEEFRVLTAVEMGSKNHEVVPSSLITQISGLRNGGVNKHLGSLAKRNLIARVQNTKYDGYRLTYGGYDYLAMRALSKRNSIHSVGNQIGVGKESDIYVVADEEGKQMVLKLHRLGRTSFRTIKTNRDYMGKRKSASWMYMSRLGAQKEWAFMKILYEHGFPVPKPIDQARHCIVMELMDAFPLRQINEVASPGQLYSELMDLIVRFAHSGLIHGDFNEFNILIREDTGKAVVIDFPQMVSTSHENAEWYFNRDVECIRTFFRRRFRYESAIYPKFRSTLNEPGAGDFQLDVIVAASGFSKQEMKALEEYIESTRENEDGSDDEEESEEEDEDESVSEEDGETGGSEAADGSDRTDREEAAGDVSSSSIPQDLDEDPQVPRSSCPSPSDSLVRQTAALGLRTPSPPGKHPTHVSRPQPLAFDKTDSLKETVSAEVSKRRAREESKHHARRSTKRMGRARGSKAKQDTRVKADTSGFWD